MKIAERVAERFDNDGTNWEDAGGRTLEAVCKEFQACGEYLGQGRIRWTFPDDSVITAVGAAWDIGYVDCWCWRGEGHVDDCDNEKE